MDIHEPIKRDRNLNITVVQREGQSGTMLARELSQQIAFEIQKQEVTWK